MVSVIVSRSKYKQLFEFLSIGPIGFVMYVPSKNPDVEAWVFWGPLCIILLGIIWLYASPGNSKSEKNKLKKAV